MKPRNRRKLSRRRRALLVVCLLAAAVPAAAEPDAETLAVLRAELAALKQRVAELEARLQTGETAAVPSPNPAPTPVPVPESRPSVTVGGRIKLDVIANSRGTGGGSANRADVALSANAIPLDGDGEDGRTKFSARNSRLWVKALAPAPRGDIAAYLELDLFSDSVAGNESVTNGYAPRLRHAYAQWNEWLAGQTYSTAIDLEAYPEINDDGIAPGAMLVRQPLLRWRTEHNGHEFAIGIESPDSLVRARDGRRLSPDDERLPDFAMRYVQRQRWGHWSVGLLAREIRVDQALAEDAAFGAALGISGKVRVAERDDIRFLAAGGNAVGRYLGGGFFDDARIGPDGDLDLAVAAGGYAAYRHWWSRHWRSNVVVGGAWMSDRDALPTENEYAYSVHANLIWSPLLTTSLGIEWIHAVRERIDGRDGALHRLQFTALHTF